MVKRKKSTLKRAEEHIENLMLGESDTAFAVDEEQDRAIKHGTGPLLIVAGAGTGKTRVITERIAHLINSKMAKPEEILALTFSEKAAKEMERRVDALVPYGMVETHISTFHSFGHNIIGECFTDLRMAPDWRVLKKPDSIIFTVENLEYLGLENYRPLNNPAQYVSTLVDLVSKLKDNLITPSMYIDYVAKTKDGAMTDEEKEIQAKHEELARFYFNYERLKIEKNFVDFGDLIMIPYFLFRDKKAILDRYRERHKFILIDEFQDTNYAQFELIKLIADKYRNITVVGDDDQMIYRFRGAAISNIMGFRDYYPESKVVVLKNNYRTVQPILDGAYRVIRNNTDRLETKLDITKSLVSKYKPSHRVPPLTVRMFSNFSEEADFIADEIERYIKKESKYAFRDVAILLRAKGDARMFLKTLEKRGIPFKFTGDEGLFSRKEVQFLINFCRMLATPFEFNPLYDIAVSKFYNIDPYIMSKIGNRSKEYSITSLDMMRRLDTFAELAIPPEEADKVRLLLEDVDHYIGLAGEGWSAGEILYDYINNRRIFESLLKEKSIESDRQIANISKFFEILKQFSISDEYDTVNNFVTYIDLRQRSGDNPESGIFDDDQEDSVQVATIHKAKGLEFKVVFVCAMIQEKFPVRSKGSFPFPLPEELMKDMVDEKLYAMEEERRLFYVAVTRAKEALYLTYSKQYEGAGNKKPSMFLLETGYREPEVVQKTAVLDRLRFFEKGTAPKPDETAGTAAGEKTLYLSNYQIDDYLTCPFKYKLIHVLRIPIKENPNIIYGQAMHKVASEFYKARQEGRNVKTEDMQEIFRALWKPTGFISRQHEQRRFEQGLHTIEEFCRTESQN
ncbi:MAG: ATP-dependent helicase, partial [Spirochaetia bacterium]|nr:ATP-dependent helicase [Spirochaetia bacterium]